jgi:hypothetical protein
MKLKVKAVQLSLQDRITSINFYHDYSDSQIKCIERDYGGMITVRFSTPHPAITMWPGVVIEVDRMINSDTPEPLRLVYAVTQFRGATNHAEYMKGIKSIDEVIGKGDRDDR